MDKKWVSFVHQIKISSSEPLTISSQFEATVILNEFSGDPDSLTAPIYIWLRSTRNLEIKDKSVKQLSPDEIKRGLLQVSFLVKVEAIDIDRSFLVAYLSYNGRF